jgi:hypothetical protein
LTDQKLQGQQAKQGKSKSQDSGKKSSSESKP